MLTFPDIEFTNSDGIPGALGKNNVAWLHPHCYSGAVCGLLVN